MPGFLASLFVDPATRDGCVLLTNATSGIGTEWVPRMLLGDDAPDAVEPWQPTSRCPSRSAACPGCGSGATPRSSCAGTGGRLRLHELGDPDDAYVFELRGDRIVGDRGLPPRRDPPRTPPRRRSVSHLECATFVYTRVPYDPDVAIPGGHPKSAIVPVVLPVRLGHPTGNSTGTIPGSAQVIGIFLTSRS